MDTEGNIIVRERSSENVTGTAYRRLETSKRFWELVDAGVVSLIRSKRIPNGVRAASLVGQAVLEDGTIIFVKEKADGVVGALLDWSLPEDIRDVNVPSPVGHRHETLELFIRKFLSNLGYYLSRGRLKSYIGVQEISAIPRGRLDVRGTVRLMARGGRGMVSQWRPTLTANILHNRLLALALMAVETYYASRNETSTSLALARTYRPLFEDVDTFALRRERRERLHVLFTQAMDDRRTTVDLRAALAYGRAIVLNFGAWSDENDTELPHAFFLNVESLWEDAVRQVTSEVLMPLRVKKGSIFATTLFPDVQNRYVADPDFVATDDNGVASLVGDCKYKDLESYPDHSDVYQLAAHAATFHATECLLVYPGEVPFLGTLGKTRFGPSMFWAKIRPSSLKEDLVWVLGNVLPNHFLAASH